MNDSIDDFFEREREAVPLLAPPSGRFDQLQTVARRRRNRNTTVVSVAAAVVLGVVGTGSVLGAQQLGHGQRDNGNVAASSLTGFSATPSAGASAVDRDPTVPSDFKAASITFVDHTAWALGTHPCGSQQCAVILQTTSSPFPWQAIAAPDADATKKMGLASGDATIRMSRDKLDGWIVDAQQVLSTHDGGLSWSSVAPLAGQHISALEAWGKNTYALGADGTAIWLSTDPTVDVWSRQPGLTLPASAAGTADTLTPDNEALAAVRTTGSTTTVNLSLDHGRTWRPLALPCPTAHTGPAPLFGLLDDSYARVICGNGDTYRLPFAKSASPVWTSSLKLPGKADTTVARSVTSNGVVTVVAYSTGLWSTYDKGVTWQKDAVGDFSYVGLTDDYNGVALAKGAVNEFWDTYNGGKDWRREAFR